MLTFQSFVFQIFSEINLILEIDVNVGDHVTLFILNFMILEFVCIHKNSLIYDLPTNDLIINFSLVPENIINTASPIPTNSKINDCEDYKSVLESWRV